MRAASIPAQWNKCNKESKITIAVHEILLHYCISPTCMHKPVLMRDNHLLTDFSDDENKWWPTQLQRRCDIEMKFIVSVSEN